MGLDMCPKCGAYTRHRLACLVVPKLSINESSKILHFAPEFSVAEKIQSYHPEIYVGADKFGNEGRASNLEIKPISAEQIPYAANTFTGIIASHIMEHVDDEHRCIKSFYRVLQPRQWILLMIPIFQHLLDQKNPTDFGQSDHKRLYTPKGLYDKMTSHHFSCEPILDMIRPSHDELEKYAIHQHHRKYVYADIVCRKKSMFSQR